LEDTTIPRNGAGTLSAPLGIRAEPGEEIRSAQFNAFLDDWVADGNDVRPLSAGGTGATSKTTAQTSLGLVPQASTIDTTAGSLLINGAWGLGGAALVAVPGDDCDLITRTGFYKGTANTTLHMPTDIHAYAIQNQQYASNVAMQQATRSDGRMYTRAKNFTTSFGDWILIDDLVESGSNANGEYRKFRSGYIECSKGIAFTAAISTAYMGAFRTATQTWTYPKAFTVAPRVFLTVGAGSALGANLMGGTDETQAFFALNAASSQSSDTRYVHIKAFGS
jgi:hypothetical protein